MQARPVYVTLPMDLVNEQISSDRLDIPLSSSHPSNNPDTEQFVLDLIQERVIEAAGDVVVLVDACVIRHHCREEVFQLLRKSGFPVYATPMGKTAIDESYNRYGGVRFYYSFLEHHSTWSLDLHWRSLPSRYQGKG